MTCCDGSSNFYAVLFHWLWLDQSKHKYREKEEEIVKDNFKLLIPAMCQVFTNVTLFLLFQVRLFYVPNQKLNLKKGKMENKN